MPTLLANAGKQGRPFATALAQEDAASAHTQWRQVADPLRPTATDRAPSRHGRSPARCHRLYEIPDVVPRKSHSANTRHRLQGEINRCTNVVGILPNEDAITRCVGPILLEQVVEWAVSKRYMTLESIAPMSDNPSVKLPTVAP